MNNQSSQWPEPSRGTLIRENDFMLHNFLVRFNLWIDVLIATHIRFSKVRRKSSLRLSRLSKRRINHVIFLLPMIAVNASIFERLVLPFQNVQEALEGVLAFILWMMVLFWIYLWAGACFSWNVTFRRYKGFVIFDISDQAMYCFRYVWCLSPFVFGYVFPVMILVIRENS